jgi:hypothetical protein
MTVFTRLSTSLWDWEPWRELAMGTRNLWLGLYTSSEAKRHVPGLWQGGISVMSDAARMRPDETVDALDELLSRELVEYDSRTRVLRLCELPDPGEWPANGRVLRSWWRRFQTVPDCGVRNAHVTTLRWLIDKGAVASGKQISKDHELAWSELFGRVPIPAPRRRGVRRLSDDSDTGTTVQPSLFPPSSPSAPPLDSGSSHSVDNSASLRQSNKSDPLDTVSDTVWIQDTGSRIPDLISSSGEATRPTLTLVPSYTLDDVLAVMAQGRWETTFAKTHQDALRARFALWLSQRLTLDDFRVLAQASREFGDVWDARALALADLPERVARARQRLQSRADRMALLDEFRTQIDAVKR